MSDEILVELPIKCSKLRRISSVWNRCMYSFENIIAWVFILLMCVILQISGLAFIAIMLSIGHNDYSSFSLSYYIVSYPYAGYISLILCAIMEFIIGISIVFEEMNVRIKCVED